MIILGSGSPRRQEILNNLNIKFEVIIPCVNEIHDKNNAKATVIKNSSLKLNWCINKNQDNRIITADTVVAFNNKTIGKPKDKLEAINLLNTFSNNKLTIYTAMGYYDGKISHIYCDSAILYFKKLNNKIIKKYVAEVNPLDKAGGFNIDEHGDWLIKDIEGSHSTVMGLCKDRILNLNL